MSHSTDTNSPGEERANVISHAIGTAAGVIGLVMMLMAAVPTGDVALIVGCSIFGASVILLYAASTAYHATADGRAKQVLKALDHSAIYVLIAGTYTPFTLSVLPTAWGWTLFGIVWGLAVLGIGFKLFTAGRFRWLSTALYVGMGWVAIIAAKPFADAFSSVGLWLVLGGGLTYTLGVVFYLWDRLPYNHAIWHLFVIGGTVFHYLAVALHVIPMVAAGASPVVDMPLQRP